MDETQPVIREARSTEDYAAFGAICRAYVDWSRERYAAMPWFVEEVFGYQSLDAELELLSIKYGPPNGRTMIAKLDGAVVGAGAYRRRSGRVCELKRLFVTDAARGAGLGRRLSEALIAGARADGFETMQLDTGHLLTEAIGMYERMGFVRVAPYQDYPARLMPYLVFMEMGI